jgi:hypothetical protein
LPEAFRLCGRRAARCAHNRGIAASKRRHSHSHSRRAHQAYADFAQASVARLEGIGDFSLDLLDEARTLAVALREQSGWAASMVPEYPSGLEPSSEGRRLG